MLLFAGTVIEFKGPNWDQDPITIALPRGKRTSPSDLVKRVKLNSVIILSMSRLEMDKEIMWIKEWKYCYPCFFLWGRKGQQTLMIYPGHTRNSWHSQIQFFQSIILWIFIFCIFLSVGGIRFKLKQHGNSSILNCHVSNRSIKYRFVSTQVSLET